MSIYNRNLQTALFVIACVLISLFHAYPSFAAALPNQTAIDAFYAEREGEPLWIKKKRLNNQGLALFEVLKNAWQNGLNPGNYHLAQMEELFDGKDPHARTGEAAALQIELLLTSGFVNYVRDMSGMRVNPRDLSLRKRDWRQMVSAAHALTYLSDHKGDIAAFLNAQEPQTTTYQTLKSELIDLVSIMASEEDAKPKLNFKGLVRPGRGYSDIPKLRIRFGLADPESENDRFKYDEALVEAVKAFQTAKGLKPDGVIGKQTLHILNQSREDKVTQIMLNMERLRWVPDSRPDRFVVVNIASATLWAVENGNVRFEMPVIVGRKKRETLSFITYIHGVRFNPTWTVPPTIKEEDILPKLREDPYYLANKGMELYRGYGKNAPTLDPTAMDWDSVREQDLHGLRMVQVAGRHNPLGRIRVLMPNNYNIYLHDTNNKSLFHKSNRAKSSGCVRMKDPEKVAMFALEKRKGWSEESMRRVLKKSKTSDIYTSEKMPVYLLYYTVWTGDQGQLVYGRDIYDQDMKLKNSLKKIDGLPIY